MLFRKIAVLAVLGAFGLAGGPASAQTKWDLPTAYAAALSLIHI